MRLKTINDSHIKLKMEINGKVCILLENSTKIQQNRCSMEVKSKQQVQSMVFNSKIYSFLQSAYIFTLTLKVCLYEYCRQIPKTFSLGQSHVAINMNKKIELCKNLKFKPLKCPMANSYP